MNLTPRHILKTSTLSLSAAVLALSLVACGGDEETSSGTDESTPAETSEPTEQTPTPEETPSEEAPEEAPSEEAPDEEAPAGDLAKPGSELSIGDSAIVTGDYAGKKVVFELTVDEIVEGTSADLKKLKIQGANPDELTPFYIKVSSAVVSGTAQGYDPATDLDGFAGEQPAQSLIEFGDFKPCNGEAYETDAAPGDTLDSCTTQIVAKGQSVDTVIFGASDTPYDKFDGKPITWS